MVAFILSRFDVAHSGLLGLVTENPYWAKVSLAHYALHERGLKRSPSVYTDNGVIDVGQPRST